MKNICRLLLALSLGLALVSPAFASSAHVTTLTTTAGTIVIPGIHTHFVTIQNNTATAITVNISFDGGASYIDPYAYKAGTNPTTGASGLGYRLAQGQQIIISYASASMIRPIVAITQSGTAILDITTDDTQSTFPTT